MERLLSSGGLRVLVRGLDPRLLLLLAWAALLGVEVPVPLLDRFSPSDLLLLAVLLLTPPGLLLAAPRRGTPVHFLLGALAVSLAWGSLVGIARLGADIPYASFLRKDVGLLILVAIFLVTRTWTVTVRDVRRLLLAALIGGSAVAYLSFSAFVAYVASGAVIGEESARFSGFLLNANAEGLFLGVLLAIQLGVVARGTRPRLGWLNGIALTLMLFLTLSRSSWIAAICGLAIATILCWRRTWLPTVLLVVLASAIASSLSLAPARSQTVAHPTSTNRPDDLPPSLRRFASAVASTPPTRSDPTNWDPPIGYGFAAVLASQHAGDPAGASDRIALLRLAYAAWTSTLETPLVGLGLGVYQSLTPYTSYGEPLIIHDTYVWLPAELGLPGIVTALALVLCFGWAFRGVSGAPVDARLTIRTALVVLAVWMLFNEGLYQRTLWLVLAVAASSVVGRASPAASARSNVATSGVRSP